MEYQLEGTLLEMIVIIMIVFYRSSGGSRSGIFGGHRSSQGGWNQGRSNMGPPPAYSANRNMGGRTNPREPPPAYGANQNTGFGQNAHYRNQQQGGFFGGSNSNMRFQLSILTDMTSLF